MIINDKVGVGCLIGWLIFKVLFWHFGGTEKNHNNPVSPVSGAIFKHGTSQT
jgi:hypothetical protein